MKSFSSIDQIIKEGKSIPLFARWQPKGKMPIFSRNHQTGKTEAGLSVNGLSGRDEATVAGNLIEYAAISGGSLMIVTGKENGTGSDGEPVIVDVKIVGKASPKLIAEAELKDRKGKCKQYTETYNTSRKTNNAAFHAMNFWCKD